MLRALCVGALPFVFIAGAYAGENADPTAKAEKKENKWLDDYSAPVGFTYHVQSTVQAAYLWRGLRSGGPNIQISADVGYGGLYFNVWTNVGVRNMQFNAFQPELDLSLGFQRWGLNVYLLMVHNFNCGFFDFDNYDDRGNRLEVDVCYTVSSKLPLCIRWGTRVYAADGYRDHNGNLVRAHSSYLELSYTYNMRDGYSLYGAFGLTPYKSVFTRYQREFAINNITLRLRKDWSVSEHCGMMVFGLISVNPSVQIDVINPNIGMGIYLK